MLCRSGSTAASRDARWSSRSSTCGGHDDGFLAAGHLHEPLRVDSTFEGELRCSAEERDGIVVRVAHPQLLPLHSSSWAVPQDAWGKGHNRPRGAESALAMSEGSGYPERVGVDLCDAPEGFPIAAGILLLPQAGARHASHKLEARGAVLLVLARYYSY